MSKFEVEKFTGSNDFGLWKMKMKAILVKEGLALALEGEDKMPEIMKAEEKKELLDKAYSSLILGLGDKVLREVKKETSTVGIWGKLDSLYMSKAIPNRLLLKQKLFAFKMDEQKSLADNMDEFWKIIQDLESMSVVVDDEDQVIILLNSLPKAYTFFVDTLKYERQSLKLEEVVIAIVAKDNDFKTFERSQADAENLNVKGRPKKKNWKKGGNNRGRGRSKSKNRAKKCFVCHKEGHFRRDYPERRNNKKESEAGSVNIASNGYESADVLVIFEARSSEKWVLDSGCTFHMTPNRSLFTTFQELWR